MGLQLPPDGVEIGRVSALRQAAAGRGAPDTASSKRRSSQSGGR